MMPFIIKTKLNGACQSTEMGTLVGPLKPLELSHSFFFTITLSNNQRPKKSTSMATETITTVSPSTNKPIKTRSGCSDEDLTRILDNAAKAFQSYQKTELSQRQRFVRNALQIMQQRKDELSMELTEQMGRPIAYAEIEIRTAMARAEYMLKVSDESLRTFDGEPQEGFKRYIKKVPIGLVLVIFPWNVSNCYRNITEIEC